MPYLEFEDVFFETTSLAIVKHDGADKFILKVENPTAESHKVYSTMAARDADYDSLKATLTAPPVEVLAAEPMTVDDLQKLINKTAVESEFRFLDVPKLEE